MEESKITDHSSYINWEQRRYELAKANMQAIVSSAIRIKVPVDYEHIAASSIYMADAMIKELKGE